MLEIIEEMLGKKVEIITSVEALKNIEDEESVSFLQKQIDEDTIIYVDTLAMKEESEEEIYYIMKSTDNGKSCEFVDYVKVVL